MSFEEKVTWVGAVVGTVVPIAYFAAVLGQLGEMPVADIEYQRPLIVAIGAAIALMILGAIAMAVATAIGAEVLGTGSVDDIDAKDERDVSIGRRGDLAGFYALSVGTLGALVITMLEYDYFWIANALYLSFAVAFLVSTIVKIAAYRRGF